MENRNSGNYLVSYVIWFNKLSLEARKKGEFKLENFEAANLKAAEILLEIASRETEFRKVVYGVYSVATNSHGELPLLSRLNEFDEAEIAALIKNESQRFFTHIETNDPAYQEGLVATNTNFQLTLGSQQIRYDEPLELFLENNWVTGQAQRDRKGKWTFKSDEGSTHPFQIGTKVRRKV